MGTTPSGIWYADSTSSTRIWELMRQQSESLDGRLTVPVPNAAARNALAASFDPTPAKPLWVHQADAPSRLQWTEDGETWQSVDRQARRIQRRTVNFPIAAFTNLTITQALEALPGDQGEGSSIALNAGTFTVSEPGLYFLGARWTVPYDVARTWTIGFLKNGARAEGFDLESRGATGVSYTGHQPLQAGDTLLAFLRQAITAGTTTTVEASTNRLEVIRTGSL